MASAQSELSETDRELLLERLKAIQDTSNKTVQSRFSVAVSAFKSAVDSDGEALALFLKCHEKVSFEDQAKKSQDFREWKRRFKDRHDNPGFKRALRHQLAWLLATIEVAGNPNSRTSATDKANGALDAIFRDAKVLDGFQGVLGESVLASVFARAYELNKLSVPDWPKAPLAIDEMYELIIMRPLRTPDTLTKLRSAWMDRIKHEGLTRQVWGAEGTAGKDRKPDFENWMKKGRLELMWQMETDLFSAGDQRAAALRMLDHLKENLSHSSAPQWITEFTNLINGKPAREEEKPG
ncbi:hypothetical protein N9230_06130, partial [Akkermansiaceae bacterium]|nr:hypothetical protein [Akkermansiaceae bacterium]